MLIRMIHFELQNDPIHNTGVWEPGEVRDIPADLGVLLIKQRDVFQRVEEDDLVSDEPKPKPPSEFNLQEINELSLARMEEFIPGLSTDEIIELFEIEQNREQPRTSVMKRLQALIAEKTGG